MKSINFFPLKMSGKGLIVMQDKIAVQLGNVEITLLLPLWGRAVESAKIKSLLKDKTAVDIINKIDYDFSTISKNIHLVTRFEWVARSIHIDRTIREFTDRHPKATIINIGCGLDTTFERVDNGSLYWYDLDLPNVIELRRKFIPESDRRKFISCSFHDDSWLRELHTEDNIIFAAAGVFYYFEEFRLKEIFNKIAQTFPGCEFIFDAASPFGVTVANKKVIESSGLDEKSYLKWGLQSAAEMTKWNDKIEVVKEYPMFRHLRKGLSFKDKITSLVADHYKIMYMVHLRISN